jgi:hypothetical protein
MKLSSGRTTTRIALTSSALALGAWSIATFLVAPSAVLTVVFAALLATTVVLPR